MEELIGSFKQICFLIYSESIIKLQIVCQRNLFWFRKGQSRYGISKMGSWLRNALGFFLSAPSMCSFLFVFLVVSIFDLLVGPSAGHYS